jgi:hypothetical protein
MTMGHTQGGSAVLDAGRVAIGVGLRTRDLESDATGQEYLFRLSLKFGAARVQICPGFGVGFARDEWSTPTGLTLTSNALTARAGAGIGFEQEVHKGLSAIPFVVVQYAFTATAFDLDDGIGGDAEITGDTLSRVDIEYGLMARYRFLYGGIAAQRNSERSGNHPYMARWIIGFAFKQQSARARS